MKYKISVNNIDETILIGKILGSFLKPGLIIGLDGDLGCGKTHLTKGIALGLNIDDVIKSPTFTLINEYTNKNVSLYHFDVYRLNSVDELFLIGFDEYLKNDGIKIIEWSSLIQNILPDDTNYINIYKSNENMNIRTIEFNFYKQYEDIVIKTINNFKKEF